MAEYINTIIVGGGQGGLATSYYLQQHGIPNVIFDKSDKVAHSWRNRWDSFTLVTPNWMVRLPGAPYDGDNPDGFMTREEIVVFFDDYVDRFTLPLELGISVSSIKYNQTGYVVRTNAGRYEASNVLIATGYYQKPRIPSFHTKLSSNFTQLHSSQYKNPQSLSDGAVLVVGSAQSGAQMAEELYQSGRKVFLSVSGAGRLPRRYRGRDVTRWMKDMGYFDRTVDELSSPKDRFASSSQATGKNGGHTINLHQFAKDGVVLMGRVEDAVKERIILSDDLKENLARDDKFEAEFIQEVDQFIKQNEIDASPESLPKLTDGYDAEVIQELNLKSSGIKTVIWATGYQCDYSLVKVPVFDEEGIPIHNRGVTDYPGLYFIGLPFLYTGLSGVIAGVGTDAKHIASEINCHQYDRLVAHQSHLI